MNYPLPSRRDKVEVLPCSLGFSSSTGGRATRPTSSVLRRVGIRGRPWSSSSRRQSGSHAGRHSVYGSWVGRQDSGGSSDPCPITPDGTPSIVPVDVENSDTMGLTG